MNDTEFEKIIIKKNKRIQELEIQVNKLERRLLAYENAHTPPSLQKKKTRILRESSGILGAPKGHPKYEREEPDSSEIKKHSIDTCPFCNLKLENKEILEVIEEELPNLKEIKVTKHLIEWGICPHCKKRAIAKNDAPPKRFGPNLRAHITLLKHEDRLPLRKVESTLERNYGFTITHTGIMKIIQQVAKRLNKPYYDILKRIRSSKVVYVDETSYKLNGENWWLWTFVTQNEVLFVIRKSRSKKIVEEVLGKKFHGIISCDGWSAYPNFTETLQRCWAHLLRESFHLLKNHKNFKTYDGQLNELFQEVKSIRLKPPSEEERRLLAIDMKEKLRFIAERMSFNSSFKKLATKILNGIDYWFTCVEHLDVEPTNNYAEQALRELIVQRKIMGGLRSEKGAETLEVISTMIATWKKQERPLLETMKNYIE